MEIDENLSIDTLQVEVGEAVDGCSKGQLGQVARLLATYVALYKHEFGELNQDRFAILTRKLATDPAFGEAVYATGLRELLETLCVAETQIQELTHTPDEARTLN